MTTQAAVYQPQNPSVIITTTVETRLMNQKTAVSDSSIHLTAV